VRKVLIALDYDDTFTADPELWASFCRYAQRRGHTVICATMRHEAEGLEVVQALFGLVSQIVFTGRQAKRPALAARGLAPDVWIDDEPRWILEGA
jgi:hypothetical protein